MFRDWPMMLKLSDFNTRMTNFLLTEAKTQEEDVIV